MFHGLAQKKRMFGDGILGKMRKQGGRINRKRYRFKTDMLKHAKKQLIITQPEDQEFLTKRFQEMYELYSDTLQKSKELEEEEKKLKYENKVSKDEQAILSRELREHQMRLIELRLKDEHNEKTLTSLKEELETIKARLHQETSEKQIIQIELENASKRGSDNVHATDPEDSSLEDLARLFAKLFNLECHEVQNRAVVNGHVVTCGVSEWFKFIVEDGFHYINTKLQGTLTSLQSFLHWVFEHHLADSFCEFLRDFQKYKECRFEQMTGKDRKAIELHRKQSDIKFIAKLTDSYKKSM